MSESRERLRPALDLLRRPPEPGADPAGLTELARASGLSRFHFHRTFAAAMGETGKRFGLRVRLSRAAAALLRDDRERVLDVAVRHGFAGAETFVRAFRRQFGTTPTAYRRRGLRGVPPGGPETARHAEVVDATAACVGLYRTVAPRTKESLMSPEITLEDAPAEDALLVRRRIPADEVAKHLGDILPGVFSYAQRAGIALSGPPVVRYSEHGPASFTIEAGFPVAAASPGEDAIQPATLGGTRVASTVHVGPYEDLPSTYRAMESWMDAQGLESAGDPWEQYITDPGDEPDSAKWLTAVRWPVTPRS